MVQRKSEFKPLLFTTTLRNPKRAKSLLNILSRFNNQVLTNLKAKVYGISTQSTAYQKEMVERLHLPFEVLSDEDLKLAKELNLPTLIVNDMTLFKRITLICKDNKIVKVFYPVFPPDKNVDEVINWIENN